MQILEFGNKNNKKIILIHGFQSPYQVWDKYIEHYKNDYHIIVPILPGHNPNQIENFISFEIVAKELEDYLISEYDNNVYVVYGMSMGGVLVATLWKRKKLHIQKLIFDGSPLVSINGIMKKIMINFYIGITQKTLEQAQKTIISKECMTSFLEVLDNMTEETIRNCINDVARFHVTNTINEPNTTIYFYHGTAMNEMLAQKSAIFLSKHYKNVKIKSFKGRGHCELTLLYPDKMINELKHVL